MRPSLTTDLAPEIIILISHNLPGSDIKNLRLTCRAFASLIRLRLHRIFISSNPLDIAVFRAVADHETFRHAVKEIIWDDARFPMKHLDKYHQSPCEDRWCLCDEQCARNDDGAPRTYVDACRANADNLWRRLRSEVNMTHNTDRARKLAREMPVSLSWQCWRRLVRQQKAVIDGNLDIEALEYGLTRFPSLKRIRITPATHGNLFNPLHETPMIRSLPYGMNYLLPRGRPTPLDGHNITMPPWDIAIARDYYRGFTNVVRLLAQSENSSVKEVLIDASQQPTGISCEIFGSHNTNYEHLCQILRIPEFRRLDLALHMNTAWQSNYAALRNPRLHDALALAIDLESMHLATNIGPNPDVVSLEDGEASQEHFLPLQSILPVTSWPKLRHLGLSRFIVCQTDLMELLKALPLSLRSVELSFLYFLEGGGHYGSLLEQMRLELGWEQRPILERPRVSISAGVHIMSSWELSANVDVEVQDFLYHKGANPFAMTGWNKGEIRLLVGVERDLLNPEYSRIYAEQELD